MYYLVVYWKNDESKMKLFPTLEAAEAAAQEVLDDPFRFTGIQLYSLSICDKSGLIVKKFEI